MLSHNDTPRKLMTNPPSDIYINLNSFVMGLVPLLKYELFIHAEIKVKPW